MTKENNNLLAVNLPELPNCSRCGGSHKDMLLKQLLHPFTINESKTYEQYGWIQISEDKQEPILFAEETATFDIVDIGTFTRPFEVEVEDKPRHYTFWSFCRDTFQPLFIELSIKVETPNDNEQEEKIH